MHLEGARRNEECHPGRERGGGRGQSQGPLFACFTLDIVPMFPSFNTHTHSSLFLRPSQGTGTLPVNSLRGSELGEPASSSYVLFS